MNHKIWHETSKDAPSKMECNNRCQGYFGFKPKISNHLEVGKNGKTLKNLTKTPLNAFFPNR